MEIIQAWWYIIALTIERVLAVWAACHVILTKRDTRAAIGWIGLILLSPLFGPLLYFVLGINRIRRRCDKLQIASNVALEKIHASVPKVSPKLIEQVQESHPQYVQLGKLVGQLTGHPLLPENHVTPLVGGETAYPQMLEEIAGAKGCLALCSYIFDNDRAGREFIDALTDAHRRGVEVRVLIDDVGSRYSRPPVTRVLRDRGVNCHTFLPTRVPSSAHFANMRNHRKIMVVDGRVGFTGGMNIREGCRLDWQTDHPVQDVHFRFEGPVAAHLQNAFSADWAFATGEVLSGEPWFPVPVAAGETWARGISDGPDEDFDNLRLAILGAIAVAQQRIRIVTPYFLPDQAMINALSVAVMRGVAVDIVLPEKNNIRLVQWAMSALQPQILEYGCRVHLSPPPFDHTKIMLVDDAWSLVGSTNWDPRSLRLNFEFNVECYGTPLNRALDELIVGKISQCRQVSAEDAHQRRLPVRLRDGVARLLTPYL